MDDTPTHRLIPGFRERPFMMQLALAAGAVAQPNLASGPRHFGDDFWDRENGQTAVASMEKVVEGIRQYQLHPYVRGPISSSVVWSDGEARLVWHAARTKTRIVKPKANILVIPSMINGPEILDILPEDRSLLRWLARQGFNVFLLEWGNLRADPELANFDSAIGQKLQKLLTWMDAEFSDLPTFGLGYCMGGLLLAATEILNSDFFAGLVFIATPWDFKAGAEGAVAQAIGSWAEEGLTRVAHLDYMPNEWLQMIFAGVDPAQVARKFSAFADMKQNSLEAKLFVAVEDWVNSGPDLPAGIVRQAVCDWYLDNKVVQGQWMVMNKKINAKKIKKPSLVIVPARDKIVPPLSALSLAHKIPNADMLEADCGHISMMVGARAEKEVWKPMKGWIFENL